MALAAAAALGSFSLLRGHDPAETQGNIVYGCPMHPQVRSAAAGDCPICRMALEPVKGSSSPPEAPARHPHGHAPSDHQAPETPHAPVPPGSFSIPSSAVFRAFDAVSRVMVRPISLEMRGPASIDGASGGVALFFLDEGELLQPGEEGWFSPTAPSATAVTPPSLVRVSSAAPARWDARTALIHFELAEPTLAAGTTGAVKFTTRLRRGLVVKASAIVSSHEGPQVFVVSKDRRTFTRRPVEIGNVIYGLAAVVSGLEPDEQVAARHAFALDAEWRSRQDVSL